MPTIPDAPVVYIGPSISRRDAESALPGGDFRPPIARGDLYAARQHGSAVFVIIDGVFSQQEAVPPREIVDVLRDGATVIGASSMGALRAAECWPLGMRGVGAIYRLFRRGVLGSDDEVAVLMDPDDSHRALTVALINVRHAVSMAARAGRLDRATADRLTRAAIDLYYADRTWSAVLGRALMSDPDGHIEAFLATHDLKRDDALRALRDTARRIAADPGLLARPRLGPACFARTEIHRERAHDPLGGAEPRIMKRALARWHLLGGRYVDHLLPIVVARHGEELCRRIDKAAPRATILLGALRARAAPSGEQAERSTPALVASAALRIALVEIWTAFIAAEEEFAEALWAELMISGGLDAELFRWRAFRDAEIDARRRGLTIRPHDRRLAETAMLAAHGFDGWLDLRQAAEKTAYGFAPFVEHRDHLALSLRSRERMFNPRLDSNR
ncbi:TfuA-like protein [Sorangium sp. So ce145]|uniref:TfuA-like protein n=1 Tax=Sorangium sp. So ce145 TaxID=3133285 RepID=UPI003F627ACC